MAVCDCNITIHDYMWLYVTVTWLYVTICGCMWLKRGCMWLYVAVYGWNMSICNCKHIFLSIYVAVCDLTMSLCDYTWVYVILTCLNTQYMFKRCTPAVEHVNHHGAPDGSALRHSQSAVTPPARTTSRFPTPPQRMSTTSNTPGTTVSPWAKKTTLLCPKWVWLWLFRV